MVVAAGWRWLVGMRPRAFRGCLLCPRAGTRVSGPLAGPSCRGVTPPPLASRPSGHNGLRRGGAAWPDRWCGGQAAAVGLGAQVSGLVEALDRCLFVAVQEALQDQGVRLLAHLGPPAQDGVWRGPWLDALCVAEGEVRAPARQLDLAPLVDLQRLWARSLGGPHVLDQGQRHAVLHRHPPRHESHGLERGERRGQGGVIVALRPPPARLQEHEARTLRRGAPHVPVRPGFGLVLLLRADGHLPLVRGALRAHLAGQAVLGLGGQRGEAGRDLGGATGGSPLEGIRLPSEPQQVVRDGAGVEDGRFQVELEVVGHDRRMLGARPAQGQQVPRVAAGFGAQRRDMCQTCRCSGAELPDCVRRTTGRGERSDRLSLDDEPPPPPPHKSKTNTFQEGGTTRRRPASP